MDINIKLDKDFMHSYQRLIMAHPEALTVLNGFGDDQVNYTGFIDNFIEKDTVADASIDSNANVGHKDIVSLINEMSKPHSKLLAFNKIFIELKQKYGYDVAVEWLTNEWDGHLYMHDAHSTSFTPYCYAYDIERLVNEGLYFIPSFNHSAPKHLETYVDFVGEFVSFACNRSSGAVGLPSYLVYSYYFWKKDVDSGYLGLSWDNVAAINKYRDQSFQRIIYKLNQPYLRGGIQSAFTNFSIFDQSYFEALFGGKSFPDGTFMIDVVDEFMDFQKAFMEVVSEVRSKNVMTFPVLTISLLKQGKKFVNEDFARWACQHNMKWADSNFFISEDVTSLSNCCRLKSNIQDLGYFNSLGGTALEVGSVKVNTVNLARLSYEVGETWSSSEKEEKYLALLKKKLRICCLALDVVRDIMKSNTRRGLLPNYSLGLMNMATQYSTIGIIGCYEVLEEFGYVEKDSMGNTFYTDRGMEFAKRILATINEYKDEIRAEYGWDYSLNVEQIPGERAAAVLMEKDRIFYPNKAYTLPLYGNQWIPLGIKCTLAEKVRISAQLDDACGGGSIAHINLEAPLSDFDTAWKLLNYVSDAGVTYFAFNLRISACHNNHGFFGETCPICGGKKETTYQRIVGFLTPEKTYSLVRKREFNLRDWFAINRQDDLQ